MIDMWICTQCCSKKNGHIFVVGKCCACFLLNINLNNSLNELILCIDLVPLQYKFLCENICIF